MGPNPYAHGSFSWLSAERKNRNLQRFASQYGWDEDEMRRRHWARAAELLADEQGVWSVDASEFAKKGEESVGVAPQYCGALGKVANCQSGVFICYSSPKGHARLDARLYLPQCWFTWPRSPAPAGCGSRRRRDIRNGRPRAV